MLLDLRETVRNSKPIKYTLITLICVPFVLFGIGSYFSGGNVPSVATVDGEDITQPELDAAVQRQRQQLTQMFGGQLPEAFADDSALRAQALDQLVTQRVLAGEVAGQRFAVGDATLGRAIRELPAFLDEDGRFDATLYERQIRASGLSVAAFEQSFRDDTALNQFRVGVVDTSFTLPSEAERLRALARQTRTVDAVRFDLEAAMASVEPTEDDVEAYFRDNADAYRWPERVKIDWIELEADALAGDMEATEEEARERYEANRESYVRSEQRKASHILLSLDADADDEEVAAKRAELLAARERIEGGEDFADVARELSDDVGSAEAGGSLGTIAPGAMVPEFEEAVFALEGEGSLSEPVRTDFGLHLIRLDDVTPEEGRSFDEVREEIIAELGAERADREFFELRTELAEIVFDESDSLEPAAEATGLEVQSSDWLDADTIGEAGPVLSNPAVFAAANDPEVREEGNNSELIEVGDRHVVALRVTESEGERPKTLEDVRGQVVDELKRARAGERLDALADEAVTALDEGTAVAAIAADESLAEAIGNEVLERNSTRFDADVVREIFSLPRPTDAAPRTASAVLGDGDRLAYALRSVDTPPAGTDGEEDESAASASLAAAPGPDPRLGDVEFEALLGSLRSRADVDLEP